MNKVKGMKKSVSVFSMLLIVALMLTVFGAGLTVTANAEDAVPTDAWCTYAASSFDGGTGTKDDPYRIKTEAQLAKLSVDVANETSYTGKWFQLTSDLDLSTHRWNPIGQYKWNEDYTSINHAFQGNFDGNGKTIRGIYVNEETDGFSGGLFGNITVYGSTDRVEIRNLTVQDAKIFGNDTGLTWGYAGILSSCIMANMEKSALVENVHVSGSIHLTSENGYTVGGMCGSVSNVTFIGCTVDHIDFNTAMDGGGFVGVCSNSTYTDCVARGTINGKWGIGGFVGHTDLQKVSDDSTHSTFTRCVADVDVTASDWNVGGFCGISVGGVFFDCAALGDVESQVTGWEPRVAGFAGGLDLKEEDKAGYAPYHSVLTNCYFGGTVKSAHLTILPAALTANVTENDLITGCFYDAEKISNVNIVATGDGTAVTSFTATALTTAEMANAVCDGLYGHHDYAGNTCKICGMEQVSINADGYWVIDGKVTEVRASGEKGDQGEQGVKGDKGEVGSAGADGADGVAGNGGTNGLAVVAIVLGSIALVSNIAWIVYVWLEKKKAANASL